MLWSEIKFLNKYIKCQCPCKCYQFLGWLPQLSKQQSINSHLPHHIRPHPSLSASCVSCREWRPNICGWRRAPSVCCRSGKQKQKWGWREVMDQKNLDVNRIEINAATGGRRRGRWSWLLPGRCVTFKVERNQKCIFNPFWPYPCSYCSPF